MAREYSRIKLQPYIPGVSPKDHKIFSTITVYGKRRSGKSVFIKWDIQAFKHELPWIWVFTKTQLNSYYRGCVPDKFIMRDFNADQMESIMDRQEKARKMAEKANSKGLPPVDPRIGIIWDDYMGNDIKYNDALHRYYFTGRHFCSRNYYGAQHITMTPPPIRSNTDIPILFNTDYHDSLEHYWKDFAGKMDRDVFYQLFYQATRNPHQFLAINNDPNVPLAERFYTGTAEVLQPKIDYILGCKEFWRGSEKQLKDIVEGDFEKAAKLFDTLAEHHPTTSKPKAQPGDFNNATGTRFPYVGMKKKGGNSNFGSGQSLPEDLIELGPHETNQDDS